MEKANNQLTLRSEESLNLEEIALSGPITTSNQSEELLSYLKPETKELYHEVTSSRLVLPNIYEETQRIQKGVKFHEKLEEISGKINDFTGNKSKIKFLDRSKAAWYGIKDKYLGFLPGKNSEDFLNNLRTRRGIQREKFVNEIYRDIMGSGDPDEESLSNLMAAYLRGVKADISNYGALANDPEGILKALELEVENCTDEIKEAKKKKETLDENLDPEKIEEGIAHLEQTRENLTLTMNEYIETRYPMALQNFDEAKSNFEYFGTFMRVLPKVMMDLQKEVLSGKSVVGRGIREKGNEFVTSLHKLTNQESGIILGPAERNFNKELEILGNLMNGEGVEDDIQR